MITTRSLAVLLALAGALFPALALALPHAGFPFSALILLLPLLFWRRGRPIPPMAARELLWLLIGALALVLSVALAIQLNHASWQAMQYPARFLLLPLLAWLLARLPFAPAPFWWGCAAGGVGAAGLAVAQYLGGNLRPGGYLNPIMFGNLALVLAAFCLIALITAKGGAWRRVVLAVGLLGGLTASLLAESRGGWLALLLVAGLFLAGYLNRLSGRHRALFLAGLATLLMTLVGTAWLLGTQQRFLDVYQNTARYLEHGSPDGSSEAERLEMWKNALALWRGSPWIGIGPGNLDEAYAARAKAGLMDPHASTYRHAHNQYLDALATGGVLGLAGLLAVMLAPLAVFVRRLRQADEAARPYALAGIVLILLYLGDNLTQAMFAHNLGILFYVTLLAICWRGTQGNARWEELRASPPDTSA